jgi:hypothetical protein
MTAQDSALLDTAAILREARPRPPRSIFDTLRVIADFLHEIQKMRWDAQKRYPHLMEL